MAKVMEIHLAGKRAYLLSADGAANTLSRKHAKAMRKMLKHWLKIHR